MRPEVVLHVRGRRLSGRRVVARRQQPRVLLLLAQAAPVRARFRGSPVRLGHLDLVPVRVRPVLDLEHEQYDEHDDDERGRGDEHHERRALGRLRVDRRFRVLRRRRLGRGRELVVAAEQHVRRGHHGLAVALVVPASVSFAAAADLGIVRLLAAAVVSGWRGRGRGARARAAAPAAVDAAVHAACGAAAATAAGPRTAARDHHRGYRSRGDRCPRVRGCLCGRRPIRRHGGRVGRAGCGARAVSRLLRAGRPVHGRGRSVGRRTVGRGHRRVRTCKRLGTRSYVAHLNVFKLLNQLINK